MTRITFATISLSILATACQHVVMDPKTAITAPETNQEADPEPIEIALPASGSEAPKPSISGKRVVGDYITYRFTGRYRSQPLTISHRLVERSDKVLVFRTDYLDGQQTLQLRVHLSNKDGARGEVLRVDRVSNEVLRPFGVTAYQQLMAQTMLVADSNEGILGSTGAMLKLGKHETTATRTSYRVIVDTQHATLHTFTLADFAWGDAGGEILSENGQVLYRAEVTALGHGEGQVPTIASQELSDEDYDDDYDIYDE